MSAMLLLYALITPLYSLLGLRVSVSQHSYRLFPSGGSFSFDSYFPRSFTTSSVASVNFMPATAWPTSAEILGSTGVVLSSCLFVATPSDSIESPAQQSRRLREHRRAATAYSRFHG